MHILIAFLQHVKCIKYYAIVVLWNVIVIYLEENSWNIVESGVKHHNPNPNHKKDKPSTFVNSSLILTTGRLFSPGIPVPSTSKTDRHDIIENLMIVESSVKHHKPNLTC
jgi:hypothetical protein